MPLIDIWKAEKASVLLMTIEQIASVAGDGNLADGSLCQIELRQYLSEASTDSLAAYASYCLDHAFNKSGQVLQDVINELGRRLEYSVENGRYQGVKNAIGFDGLWTDASLKSLVVEVKTTDAYRISLDTIAKYRAALIEKQKISDDSSILIVVGRTDTGELEAQVRGSMHAWQIRIIGIESMIQLVRVKESAGSQDTISKIRRLLAPHEYTRVDGLVDVVFATAKDVEAAAEESFDDATEIADKEPKANGKTAPKILSGIREKLISTASVALKATLIKRTRAMYWSSNHDTRVACTISKRYDSKASARYWYAYHPSWDSFLGEGENGFLALGCVDLDVGFLLPLEVVRGALTHWNFTEKEDGTRYWHIKVVEGSQGSYFLLGADSGENLALDPFQLHLEPSSN